MLRFGPVSDFLMRFGYYPEAFKPGSDAINALCRRLKVSRAELYPRLGVSRQTLWTWSKAPEKLDRNRRMELFDALADALEAKTARRGETVDGGHAVSEAARDLCGGRVSMTLAPWYKEIFNGFWAELSPEAGRRVLRMAVSELLEAGKVDAARNLNKYVIETERYTERWNGRG